MERNKIEEFLNSGDVEIVQLGVSLLIEQGVERPEIETLLAPTRFAIFGKNDVFILKEKVNGGIYNQLKAGNWKVVNIFNREYIL
jgi:hypothetical protein